MFSKILIANRGEIACRVIKTARYMGVRTVAVYSEADRDAPHVLDADEAYAIGPAPVAQSYLDQEKILAVAKESGAEAIHPGYGFLSENAGFARACEAAGIVFIGPRPDSIDAMGSKAKAKELMAAAGVPLAPGYEGEDQSVETFLSEAEKIGYPILLKATAGGGGKGMRIVEQAADLPEALASAKREAANAFGDDRFLVEKFLRGPRHLEVQVFGDSHGNIVHLFERDCSVQRRYQKVIEEAPAPELSDEVRERLLSAGVEAAKAVNYLGAGTVEFLYDGAGGIYFMEMNTRLQVEHPVTEEVTGLDLVEWQLRVAAGEPLPLDQDQIYCDGHAIEARVYAEDPSAHFMPSIGPLEALHLATGTDMRLDTGVRAPGAITAYYDPMIAKVIARGETRGEALRTLSDSLDRSLVGPVRTNLSFLHRVLEDSDFVAGGVSTTFLDGRGVLSEGQPAPADMLAAFVVAQFEGIESLGWRLNQPAMLCQILRIDEAGDPVRVTLSSHDQGTTWSGHVGDEPITISNVEYGDDRILYTEGGRRRSLLFAEVGAGVIVRAPGVDTYLVQLVDGYDAQGTGDAAAGGLTAAMPGTVTSVAVAVGDEVTVGDTLLTLEAMKMETVIKAPTAGIVEALNYQVGDAVPKDAPLVTLTPKDHD